MINDATSNQHLDHRVTDLVLRYRSAGSYETQPFVPGEEGVDGLLSEVRSLSAEVLTHPATQFDGLLRNHWLEVLETLTARIEEDQRYPFRYVGSVTNSLSDLLFDDPRPASERLPALLARLDAAPSIISEAGAMTASLTIERREQVERSLDALLRVVERAEGAVPQWERAEDLAEGLAGLKGSALALKADLKGLKPDGSVADLPYERVMAEIFGADLATTLEWADGEIARCDEEYRSLAARLSPGKSPKEILAVELPHAPNPEAMLQEMVGYVDAARNACLALMTLPDGEVCDVGEVPDDIKDSYPWGAYRGGNILRGNLRGSVFLNKHNYTAVSRGWMQMMALHECYPGHHAQRVKATAGSIPLSFKVGMAMTRDSHLTEGIAHRSERMLEGIFPDRAFPLFVAYRRLHTAVRVRADIELNLHRRPVAEVAELYRRYLDFTEPEAMGQILFQVQWPGYMTTYYTGMRELERLEATHGLTTREWNELLFSSGYISMKTLKGLLPLEANQRKAILEGRI